MKRAAFTLTIILLAAGYLSAQAVNTEIVYQKYRGEEGVISIWIPGFAMKLAANIADLDGEEEELLRCIRSLRVLTIEESDLYPDVNFAQEVRGSGREGNMKLMLEVNDSGDEVLIYGKEKKGSLRDILIVVGGEDNVIVHVKGRIKTDMIASLAGVAGIEKANYISKL